MRRRIDKKKILFCNKQRYLRSPQTKNIGRSWETDGHTNKCVWFCVDPEVLKNRNVSFFFVSPFRFRPWFLIMCGFGRRLRREEEENKIKRELS